MPIRYRDQQTRLGQIGSSLAGATSLFQGTFAPAVARTGVVSTQLDGATALLQGNYTLAPNRTGVIGTALDGAGAIISGIAFVPGTADDITTLSLTAAVGGSLIPWTFGQAFKQGDVPSTARVTSDETQFQADIVNRWPDGSAKFAILSGRSTLTSNVAKSIKVQRTTSPPSGSPLTLAQMRAAFTGTNTVQLGAFGTVDLTALANTAPFRAFVAGPQMSEWHWRSPVGSDPHLVVWLHLRYYAGGGIEATVVVENGYLKVASPSDKSYTATITINGTSRYSAAVTHFPRTRWTSVNWYANGSGMSDWTRVIPAHNATYLRSTKLFPNYDFGAPTTTVLNSFAQTYTPLTNGNLAPGSLAAGGYARSIGLLPQWDAAYIRSADARAYRGAIVNAWAGDAWPVCYRDENTNRLLALSQRPNLDAGGWNVDPVVPGTGSNVNSFGAGTEAHMPACGYTAYLLTGRWCHAETQAFWAIRSHLQHNPTRHTVGATGARRRPTGEDRGKGWHMRTIAQAITVLPDAMPDAADNIVRTDLQSLFSGVMQYWQTNTIGNPIGYFAVGDVFNKGNYGGFPNWVIGVFQGYFCVASFGYAWDLELGLDSPGVEAHRAVRDHFYKLPVGMLGDATGWCYQRGGRITAIVGTTTATASDFGGGSGTYTYAANWGAAFDLAVAAGTEVDTACAANGTLTGGNFPGAFSYWGNLQPAIAYAVDHLAPGADAAYNRLIGASNFGLLEADFANYPEWGAKPRVSTAVPAHITAAAEGVWTAIGSNTLQSVAFNYTGWNVPGYISNLQAIMNAWSSGAYDPVRHRLLVHGGGHNDYDGNETYSFNVATNAWTRLDNPSPYDEDAFTGGSPSNPAGWNGIFPDNGPQPIHTYDILSINPNTGKMYRLGRSGSVATRVQEFDPALATQQTPGTFRNSWAYRAVMGWPDGSSGSSCWLDDEGVFLVGYMDGGTFINFRRYNPTTDVVSAQISGNGTNYSGDKSLAYSPSRRLAVLHRHVTSSNTLVLFNTATNTASTQTVTGATLPNRCGLDYDAVRDRFIAYTDEGADTRVLYSINPATWVATQISPTTGATPTTPPNLAGYRGIYGRFAYCADYDVYLMVNSVSGSVFIYKPIGWSA